jgi:hypothetical protein
VVDQQGVETPGFDPGLTGSSHHIHIHVHMHDADLGETPPKDRSTIVPSVPGEFQLGLEGDSQYHTQWAHDHSGAG